MFRRKSIVGNEHGQSGFIGENPRTSFMRFRTAERETSAMNEQDRAGARTMRHKHPHAAILGTEVALAATMMSRDLRKRRQVYIVALV